MRPQQVAQRAHQFDLDHVLAGAHALGDIQPVRLPENSRAVWHLYAFRYDADQFHGLPRNNFIRALRAEGIPCGGGYHEQYNDGLLDEAINSRGFKRLFTAERLKAYRDSFEELKGNKEVCETNVGFFQTLLLADRSDMDHIIEAIRKIHAHSAALAT